MQQIWAADMENVCTTLSENNVKYNCLFVLYTYPKSYIFICTEKVGKDTYQNNDGYF